VRRSWVLGLIVAAVGMTGCVGDTDPAAPVRGTRAQLNAHGHTNNGPAYWWWEYGTSQSAVTNGSGTDTLHRGPASSDNDVKLSEIVKGLQPATTYYFRACGRDQSSSTQTCGRVLSFHTRVASALFQAGDMPVYVFQAAPGTRNNLTISLEEGSPGHWRFDDPIQNGFGASILSSTSYCKPTFPTGIRDDSARCAIQRYVTVTLGDLDDQVSVGPPRSFPWAVNLYGEEGNDFIDSDDGNDQLDGGAGGDVLNGGFGDDRVIGGPGDASDTLRGSYGNDYVNAVGGSRSDGDDIDCGEGNDVLYTDAGSIADNYGAKRCETIQPIASG
jgi:Ca2+-binding RTX toxin-like protein